MFLYRILLLLYTPLLFRIVCRITEQLLRHAVVRWSHEGREEHTYEIHSYELNTSVL